MFRLMTKKLKSYRTGATAFSIIVGGLLATVAQAEAATLAGTEIINRAEATYFNTQLGAIETIQSNTVSARVLPVPAIDVVGGQELLLARTSEGQYNYRATNTGNIALDIELDVTELTTDDYDVIGELFIDRNSNGIIDSGDAPVDPSQSVILNPGDSASLIYSFMTPANVSIGDIADSELITTATAIEDTGSGTIDPIVSILPSRTTIDEANFSLLKSATLRADDNQIDYFITARNNSEGAITPYSSINNQQLRIDGIASSGVVVRDQIPLNTTFVSAAEAGGFDLVYHVRGNAEHSYTQTVPEDLNDVDAIAFLHDGAFEVGRSSDLGFTVATSSTIAALDIANTAVGYLQGGTVDRSSNEVITSVTGPGQSIEFRSLPDGPAIDSTPFDHNILVAVGAAACNLTGNLDEISVVLTTGTSNDQEILTAIETGPNTGMFQTAPIGVLRTDTAVQLNDVLEGLPGDTADVTASAVCLGETLTTEIDLQPGGFVFDSVTNTPVSNAEVMIYAQNDRTKMIAQTVSDSEGFFDLGSLPQGDYRLTVNPPFTYEFPSTRSTFTGFGRNVDRQISFGSDFTITDSVVLSNDIPLDPSDSIPVTLDKTADRSTVRRGGFIIYTLSAVNELQQALVNAKIADQLPPGLLYIEGSARRDGDPLETPPSLSTGGLLAFDLGTLTPGGSTEITYAVRVGTATTAGRKINVATINGEQAGTAIAIKSLEARAAVTVDDRGGVFSDDAVIIGRVFLDKNGDGIQTEYDDDNHEQYEPGVPGVKIVTSNGLSVVTDSEGRYSLFGLKPITSVLALQKATLPKSAKPFVADVDDAGAPGSRFIDLKRGELRTEDFPLIWTPEAEADIKTRFERFTGLNESESLLRDDLPLTFDAFTRNSSRNEAGIDTATELLTEGERRERPDDDGDLEIIKAPIEDIVKNLDSEVGFVGIADGHETTRPSLTVRVKGPSKAKLRLEVNGEEIPASQVGAKVIHHQGGVQVFEYVALRLQPGENTLRTVITDPFGNDRGTEEIRVYAPGEPTGIVIVAPETAPADSRARIPIAVRIVDDAGRLVRVPAEITLTAKNGTWDVRDIRDATHGLQAYIDNGEATFDFIPPDLVGSETIGIEADFATIETQIAFSPNLQERIFAGVIEGAIRFGEDGSDLEGLISNDEISSFEETTEGVRGQLYLKGTILGKNLLTLRYDSDQDTEERLFRDIRRDEFYPVYGDNSERGFDAQSNSKIYVKVERDQSFILYGDIAIEAKSNAIRLGAYRRSLTGGRAHIEKGPVTVDLFVAETDERQNILEQRGRGVSGPYDFDLAGIVEGSEVVEIITRDRDQPDVIISEQTQTRLSDYTLDFFRGALIFNRPIPQIDDDLNPVSIRITYETEANAGDNYLVYGGEVRIEPVEGVAIGYREVRSDADPELDERRTVRAAYVEAERRGWGKVQVEIAQTENRLGKTGEAARASYELRTDKHIIRAEAARTDEDFDAPNSFISAGREEVRVTTDHTVTDKFGASTDALYTRDLENGNRRIGAEVKGRYAVDPSLSITAGARAVETQQNDGTNEVYSGIIGAAWRPKFLPGGSLNFEYEQDFRESDNWRLSAGGDLQWNPELRFYALNEISSTESGFFGLGDGAGSNFTTRIGVEYQVNDNVGTFSEFRQSANSASEGGVANGINGQWDINEQLAVRASLEHVEPISEEDSRSSSATLGFVYENDEKGFIARNDLEVERDERGLGIFTNTAFGYKLNEDFTLLARNRFANDLRNDNRLRDRLRFGFAYRPAHDNRFKALGLYEFEIDDEASRRELAHRWSFGGTYHPTDDIRLNARYSGEHVDIESGGFSADSTLHLARAGAEVDFGLTFLGDPFGKDRFAIGGNVAAFTDNDGDDITLGAGVELKTNVIENVQVGVGYNHIDIDEDRLRDLYQDGLYARLRIKLDSSIWDEFDRVGFTSGFGIFE